MRLIVYYIHVKYAIKKGTSSSCSELYVIPFVLASPDKLKDVLDNFHIVHVVLC